MYILEASSLFGHIRLLMATRRAKLNQYSIALILTISLTQNSVFTINLITTQYLLLTFIHKYNTKVTCDNISFLSRMKVA